MKKILLFATSICTLYSCKNQEKIDRLTYQIDSIQTEIVNNENTSIQIKADISRLESDKAQQYTNASQLVQDANTLIKEYPMASSYIYEYDKETIEILLEYFNAMGDDEKDKVLLKHVVLQAYYNWDHNADTVQYLRDRLRTYDNQKRECISNINTMTNEISKFQNEIDRNDAKINLLQSQKIFFQTQLQKENE